MAGQPATSHQVSSTKVWARFYQHAKGIKMKTLILPGSSPKNLKWAMELNIPEAEVWPWPHWPDGDEASFDAQKEAREIFGKYNGQQINILAKSIGTYVLIKLFQMGFVPDKFVLCGIPLKVIIEKKVESEYQMLTTFVPEIIIQNSNDPLGSFTEVSEFIHNINQNITVISKEADNHSYPYPDEFNKYLV